MRGTLCSVLSRTIRERPEAPALLVPDEGFGRFEALRFRQLGGRALDLAGGLAALGLARGERVAFLLDRGPGWLLADLACLYGGLVGVPLPAGAAPPPDGALARARPRALIADDAATLARHAGALADAGASLLAAVVAEGEPTPPAGWRGPAPITLAALRERGRAFRERADGHRAFAERLEAGSPDEVAELVFTSATRGPARAVRLTQRNLVHQVSTLPHALGLRPGEVALAVLPPHLPFARAFAYATLAAGATLALGPTDPLDDEPTGRALRVARPTRIALDPAHLDALLERCRRALRVQPAVLRPAHRLLEEVACARYRAGLDARGLRARGATESLLARARRRASGLLRLLLLDRPARLADGRVLAPMREELGGALRSLTVFGAPVPEEVDALFGAAGIEVLEAYGLAEAAGLVSVRRPQRAVPGTAGQPLSAVELRVVDARGREVPRGAAGEVLVRGPLVMDGYDGDPEATAAAVDADGWLHTGDRGRVGELGELTVAGPIDDALALPDGDTLDPVPVERRLEASPLIARAVLVDSGRARPAALIVPDFEGLGWQMGEVFSTPDRRAAAVARDDVRLVYDMEIAQRLLDWPLPLRLAPLAGARPGRAWRAIAQARGAALPPGYPDRFCLLATDLAPGIELGATGRVRRAVLETTRAEELRELRGDGVAAPTPSDSHHARPQLASPDRTAASPEGSERQRTDPMKTAAAPRSVPNAADLEASGPLVRIRRSAEALARRIPVVGSRIAPSVVVCLLALAATVGAAAGARAGDAAAAALLPGWRPNLALARGVERPAQPAAAATKLNKLVGAARTVFYGLSVRGEAQALFDDILERLEDFDVEEAYEVLPDRAEGTPWRAVAFEGRVEDGAYALRLLPSGVDALPGAPAPAGAAAAFPPDAAPALPAVDELLHSALRLRLRPVDADREEFEDNYLAMADGRVGLDDLRWDQILGVAEQWLRLSEAGVPIAASEVMAAQRTPGMPLPTRPAPAEGTLERVRAQHPGLRTEDLAFLALFAEAYPALYAHGRRYAELDDLVELVPLPDGSGRQAARLRLDLRLSPDKVEEDFPELADYLRDFEDLLRVELRVLDSQGRRVFAARIDSQTLRLTIELATREGQLLPTVDVWRGPVLAPRGYDLHALDDAPYTMLVSLWTNMSGVRGVIRDITIDGHYDRTGTGARIETRVAKTPTVSFSGRFFGIVPTWLVDILIPSDIDTLTADFFRVLVEGDDGRGSRARLEVGGSEGAPQTLQARAHTEILNNAVVNLAIKIANRRILPHEETAEELVRYLQGLFDAVESDTERFVRSVRALPRPAVAADPERAPASGR